MATIGTMKNHVGLPPICKGTSLSEDDPGDVVNAAGDTPCGYGPGVELECVVSFPDEPLEGPDICSRCGRPLILRLAFDELLRHSE